jgi:hypothetical protein
VEDHRLTVKVAILPESSLGNKWPKHRCQKGPNGQHPKLLMLPSDQQANGHGKWYSTPENKVSNLCS